MRAALLISHGSRSQQSRDEVIVLVRNLKDKSGLSIFEHAFLEVDQPNIPQGVATCVQQGATQIVVLLHFLNSGNHVLKDIPKCIKQAQTKYPRVKFQLTPFIGGHPHLVDCYQDILEEYVS